MGGGQAIGTILAKMTLMMVMVVVPMLMMVMVSNVRNPAQKQAQIDTFQPEVRLRVG